MLDHLNLTARNFEEAAAWYGKVFGFEVVERGVEKDGPWGILRKGDSMLCVYESPRLLEPGASGRSHRISHFGLRIRDREEWERTLKEHSIPIDHGGPIRYAHSTSWYIQDPTGHAIEVALWDEDRVRFDG